MPRRSSSRGSSPRSSSPNRSTYSSSLQRPTIQRPVSPPTTRTSPGVYQGPGLLGTMAQGMAFGAGSEVGHQALRSLTGGGGQGGYYPEQVQQQGPAYYSTGGQEGQAGKQLERPCEKENMDFINCFQNNASEIVRCQPYLDAFKECEKKVQKSEKGV